MTADLVNAPEGFTWTREAWGRGLRADALSRVAPHVFTTRDLSLDANDGEWAEVARALGVADLVRLRQVHGAEVVVVRRGARAGARPERLPADILVSDDPSVAVAVQAADCVPLLIGDPVTGAVAAAHAGWRGLAARVPERAVRTLIEVFGARAPDLVAAVGPSIGPCCYEVGSELDAAFASAGFSESARGRWFAERPDDCDGRLVLDLWTTVADQLGYAGLDRAQLSIARLCTVDNPALFPSYRRDRSLAGRLAAAIRSHRSEPGARRTQSPA